MATLAARADARPLHPLHAMLLAFPLALFVGALLSDLAYWSSHEIQWTNFASWLNAGGLLVGAFALLWALVELVRSRRRGRPGLYFLLLLAMWVLAFINALVHSRDAWGSMPAGLWLSAIVALLAIAAAWTGYSGFRTGDVR
ncbi:DUF2231 domain-containing protein [Sphingosinicella sp. CPCC 101087]|uniref:DUF2231 domain-containing protein n=1 Tax=Sphingosinicella sp. CPCC 101087 TaxID=2497754 RepID=UPI00101DBDA4